MDWEVKDYRKKDPKKDVEWIDWQVPRELASPYLWRMGFWVILVPMTFFGTLFTASYIMFLVLLVDYTSYLRWKQDDHRF